MKYSDAHIHLTAKDLETVSGFDAEALTEEQLSAVMEMEKKLSECPVCMARYRFFTESEGTLHALEQLVPAGLSPLAQVLSDRLSTLEERLRDAVSRWLDSPQALLRSLDGTTLRPAAAGAVRGAGRNTEPAILPVPAGDGSFRFRLEEASKLIFRIPRSTENGSPVCLLILGCGGTGFTGIYPLTGLELPGLASPLLDSPEIILGAGEYTLSVPTMEKIYGGEKQ